METIDCRGMQCPKPVLETRKYLLDNPGVGAIVLVGDEIAQANVTRLATKEGYEVSSEPADDHIRLTLNLKDGLECHVPRRSTAAHPKPKPHPEQRKMPILYIFLATAWAEAMTNWAKC